MMKSIGCFVSSHGFGHASRMSAVLSNLAEREAIYPHIVTSVSKSIFEQSLSNYQYHYCVTDIGLSQPDAFTVDLDKTVKYLSEIFPFREQEIDNLAHKLEGISLVLCDISPMGIAVAKRLGVPSVVVENFTWDWLYSRYIDECPKLGFYIDYIQHQLSQVNHHIQTDPICLYNEKAFHCPPIFRTTQEDPQTVRDRLQAGSSTVVLVTMGGIAFTPTFVNALQTFNDFSFYICGQDNDCTLSDRVHLISKHTSFYHPDLINCADLVVFKTGYSTLAETYQTGTPSLIVQRKGFAESEVIEKFAKNHLSCHIISEQSFASGTWLKHLHSFKPRAPLHQPPRNGADDVAKFLLSLL